MGAANGWLIDNANSATRGPSGNVNEHGLFCFLSDELRRNSNVPFEKNSTVITAAEKSGSFDCYSSSVLFADVLTRLGLSVTVVYAPGHVLLEGETHMFETTAIHTPRAMPKTRAASQYPISSRSGVGSLTAAAWMLAGHLYAQQDHLSRSLGAFNNAVNISPENTEALFNKAKVLERMNMHGDAMETCERILKVNGSYADALDQMTRLLRKQGRFMEAFKASFRAGAARARNDGSQDF